MKVDAALMHAERDHEMQRDRDRGDAERNRTRRRRPIDQRQHETGRRDDVGDDGKQDGPAGHAASVAWRTPSGEFARRSPADALIYFAPVFRLVQVPMFESLSERLSSTVQRLRGRGRLTEANIRESLREVRIALLEADVALPVVQALIQRVQVKALGQEVLKSLTPGQALVKVVRDELTAVMGTQNTDLNLAAAPPAVVLMAGLQGAGKTTTVAKLARLLKERRKKKVMVVSADVYRPAAIEQLRTLAEQVDVLFHPSSGDQDPVAIAKDALDAAKRNFADVLIVDTAGRLHIDTEMMAEIKALHAALNPIETLVRRRFDDRPGRGEHREGVFRRAAA